jgi:hypothetical protein
VTVKINPYCVLYVWQLCRGFPRVSREIADRWVCPASLDMASLLTMMKVYGQSLMCTETVRVIRCIECVPLQHRRGDRKGVHMMRLLR